MKKVFAVLILLSMLSFTIAARGKSPTNSTSSNPTVHLLDMGFAQSSITINKGSTLTLVNTSLAPSRSWMEAA